MQPENKALSLQKCSLGTVDINHESSKRTFGAACRNNNKRDDQTPHGSLYFKERRKVELTLQSILSSTDICKALVTALLLRGIE